MFGRSVTPASLRRSLGAFRRIAPSGQNILRLQTNGTSTATTDETNEDFLKCAAKKVTPPLLFPWRHGNEIPQRLLDRERDFDSNVVTYETSQWMINSLTAKAYLQAPFLDLLLGDSWTNQLAESCSFAFAQGVASVLSNVYKVPSDDLLSTNDSSDDLSLDFKWNENTEEANNEGKTDDETTNETSAPPKECVQDDAMKNIMQAKLRGLFSSAHESGKRQIQVQLSCKPTSAQLYSLHALPGIGRSLAESHPSLMKEIEQENSARNGLEVNQYFEQIVSETGRLETTILADVLVYCDESFWVKDLETGATIQGHEDGKFRPVVHAVRLERVLTTRIGDGRSWSDWLITDIDDLLDGNRFYQPKVHHWFHSG